MFGALGKLFRRKRNPADFNAEILSHIQHEIERLRKQGLSDEEARRSAYLVFGNIVKTQEVTTSRATGDSSTISGRICGSLLACCANRRPSQPSRSRLCVTLQVRTTLPLAAVSHEIVGLAHSLAPTMPVSNIQTMPEALDTLRGLLLYQVAAGLAAALGLPGLALAVVGVYGVVSCAASQRTHEIGIRMALGARPVDVLRLFVRQGILIVGSGLLCGVLAAFAIARVAGNFLSGVSPHYTFFSFYLLPGPVAAGAALKWS